MPIPDGVSRDSTRAVVELLSGEGEDALPVQITNLEGDVTIEGGANIDTAALEAGIGAPSNTAWDGDPGDASVIASRATPPLNLRKQPATARSLS